MDGANLETRRSPKRRRVNGSHGPSRYSSPDELAASSDHEPTYHRRTSSNTHRGSTEHRHPSYGTSDPEDSPDELDHTIHTFYRNSWSRNLRPTASRHETPEAPSEISMLTPLEVPASPVTPPPPPVREATYRPYREKFVLKGHKRGVAAVRFSPNGALIASCCEFPCTPGRRHWVIC